MAENTEIPESAPEDIRLDKLAPRPGAKRPVSASAAASARAPARPPGAARRASARGPAAACAPGYQGGQMPVYMQQGKLRGSNRKMSMPMGPFRTHSVPVNVGRLSVFDAGATVDPEALAAKGLVKNNANRDWPVKILASGEIDRALTVAGARRVRRGAPEDRGGGWNRGDHRRGRHDRVGRDAQVHPHLASIGGSSQEAPLHRLHPGGVPLRLLRADAGRQPRRPPGGDRPARQPAARLPQPVRRRRADALRGLRARDHAVHHGEHHPAADDRGDPLPGAPPEGGRVAASRRSPSTRGTSPWSWPCCSRPRTSCTSAPRTPCPASAPAAST